MLCPSVALRRGTFERASQSRSTGASVVVRSSHLRLLDGADPLGDSTLVESYRRLADVFHEVLAEQSLDALLVRIADTVGDLIPHDSLTIYRADEARADAAARALPRPVRAARS